MKINDSRDETQRILTLTYNNVKQRKDGTWVGNPVTVERSINDIIPVDKALNESMLNPSILADNMNDSISNLEGVGSNDEINGSNEVASNDETNRINRIASIDEIDRRNEVDSENKDVRGEINDNEEDEKEKNTSENDIGMSTNQRVEDINRTQKVITNEKTVRKSERVRKQRYNIHPDDIGNNDDEKDENYRR